MTDTSSMSAEDIAFLVKIGQIPAPETKTKPISKKDEE